jgi:hypothetical protein
MIRADADLQRATRGEAGLPAQPISGATDAYKQSAMASAAPPFA